MAMDDTGGSGGNTQVEGLGINVDVNGAPQAERSLDNVAKAADGLATASMRTMSSIKDLDAALQKAASQAESTKGSTKDLTDAQLAQRKAAQEAVAIAQAQFEAGEKYLMQLERMRDTFNMTTSELQRFTASEREVSAEAEVFIAEMEAMTAATAQYGVAVKSVSEIEKARVEWEAANLTALNAQRARALAEQAALEESSATALNAQRIRAFADQAALEESSRTALNAQRIRETTAAAEAAAAAEKAAQEEMERNQTIFNAFKIRTMNENRAEAMAILTQQEKDAAALAEKQAMEEIKWAETSLKQKVQILERLQQYMANPKISAQTTESMFGSAAIGDLGSLNAYKQALADLDNTHKKTSSAIKDTEQAAKGLGDAFGNAKVRTEALVLAHEALQGRTKNFVGSLGVMGEYLSAANISVGLATLGVVGLGAAFVGVVYELAKGSSELTQLNSAMALTNNYAGLTRDSFHDLADELKGNAYGSIGKAEDMLTALASSGRVSADALESVGKAALTFQRLSGQSTEQVAKMFEQLGATHGKIFNDMQNHVADWAAKTNDQYHYLSAAQYEHIRLLALQGDKTEALKELMGDFSDSMDKQSIRLGILTKWYRGLGLAADWAGEKIRNFGKDLFQGPSFEEQMNASLVRYQQLAKKANDLIIQGGNNPGLALKVKAALDEYNKASQAYRDSLKSAADQADQAEANGAGVEAQRQWDYLTKMNRTQKEMGQAQIQDAVNAAAAINRSNILKWESLYKGDKAGMQKAEELAIQNGEIQVKTYDDVLTMIEHIQSRHHDKLTKQKNDGRKQELQDQLNADQQAYNQASEAADHEITLARQLGDAKQISRQEEYDRITAAYNEELKALTASEEAKLATLKAYKPLNDADAAEKIKRINDVTRAYQLGTQQINNALAESQQAVVNRSIKETTQTDKSELTNLDNLIKNQQRYNAEIGKTADMKKAADAQIQDALLVQEQLDSAYQHSKADNEDLGSVERATAAQRAKDLDEAIAKRQQYNQLLRDAAQLEAQAAADKAWLAMDKKVATDLEAAIVDGGGRGWKKLIHDMEMAFARLVLRPILDPISGGVASILYPNATQAGGTATVGNNGELGQYVGAAQNAATAYKALSGGVAGFTGMIGGGISSVGNFLGSSSISAFGSGFGMAGMGGTTAADAAAAYNAAGMTGTGSAISAGASAGTIATIAGGIAAGLIGGHMISGGYSIGGSTNAAPIAGTAIGATIGSVVPVIGTAIGAVVGGLIGGLANRAFGHGSTQVQSQGISGVLDASGLSGGQAYQNLHQDGGWFSSDKNWTQNSAIDSGTSAALTNGFAALETTSENFAKTLGVSSDALKDYSKQFDIKLTGDSSKDQQAVQDFFTSLGDELANKLVPTLAQFAQVGESAAQTLQRLSSEFDATNQAAKSLGVSADQMFGGLGTDSASARERLINYSGGASNVTSQAQFFEQNFMTQAEQLAPVAKSLNDALSSLGLQTIPQTRDEFKNLVEDLVKSGAVATEAGAKEYASLMALADAFATVHPATEDITITVDQARQDLLTAYKAEADAITQADDKMKTFAETLRSLNSSTLLGDLSPLTPEQKYAEAKSQFDKVKAAAESGDANAQSQFQTAYQNFLSASRTVNASGSQYQSDFQYAQQATDEMAKWADKQVDIGQATLDALNKQVSGLIDINSSVQSVTDAIKELATAMGQDPSTFNSSNNVAGITSLYQTLLGRNPDDAGLAFWQQSIAKGASMGEIATDITHSAEYNAKLASASNTTATTSDNGAVVSAINSLTAQVVQLRSDQQQQTGDILSNQAQTAQSSAQTIAEATTSAISSVPERVQPA